MGLKNLFSKREDSLTKELSLLPRDTKRRILENVTKRRNEILEEKILEKQLKEYNHNTEQQTKRTWSNMKEGMKNRRKELREQGILKPVIRYNKENFESPIEKVSKINRANEIKRLEEQRNKLKSGYSSGLNQPIKLKELKLKVPESDSLLFKKKRKNQYGFI